MPAGRDRGPRCRCHRPAVLKDVRVDRARYLFAVCGDDGDNAAITVAARQLLADRRGAPLACFVRVHDVDLAEMLQVEMATSQDDGLRVELFNASERAAPALLNEHPPFDEGGQTPFGPPHPLVVGLGEMGSRLVLHAARRWSATGASHDAQLKVTVIDRDAARHVERLVLRHPWLEKACEFVPHQLEVESPEFERGEFLLDRDGRCGLTGVYVCLGDDARGLASALRLRRALREWRIPIVVRTKERGGRAALLGEGGPGYENLHVFGLLDLTTRLPVS